MIIVSYSINVCQTRCAGPQRSSPVSLHEGVVIGQIGQPGSLGLMPDLVASMNCACGRADRAPVRLGDNP